MISSTSVKWIVSAILMLVLDTPCVLAEPGFYNSEPNNTPAEANSVGGEVTRAGSPRVGI